MAHQTTKDRWISGGKTDVPPRQMEKVSTTLYAGYRWMPRDQAHEAIRFQLAAKARYHQRHTTNGVGFSYSFLTSTDSVQNSIADLRDIHIPNYSEFFCSIPRNTHKSRHQRKVCQNQQSGLHGTMIGGKWISRILMKKKKGCIDSNLERHNVLPLSLILESSA